jgi:peptidoglycan/xylan/chitin deacetylase (PgdA/CDA1 family)
MRPARAGPAWKEAVKALLPRALVVRRLRRRARGCVLLTFDDGPHPEVTPAVLELLEAYGARAVFFVIGRRLKAAPGLASEILRRGHLLGNHSYLHRRSYVRAGPPQVGLGAYYRDLRRCQERIERLAGRRPRLFRPPGGRLTLKTLLAPRLLGLQCVTWSQDVRDWSFRDAAEAAEGAATLLRRVAPRDILLLHDAGRLVLPLLEILLPGLRARGYDLASGIHHL